MPVIIINPADIERVVAANPPAASHALDYFRRRPLKNSTYIAVRDILREVGNVPVVLRGDTGVRPRQEASVDLIEPMPIELDDTFSAVELDEYERSSAGGKSQLVDERLRNALDIVRATTKALCIQAHQGKIDYMMKAGTALTRYQVTYGTVAKLSSAKTPANLTPGDIIDAINQCVQKINAQLVGGPVDIIAAQDLFSAIVTVISGQKAFNANVGAGWVEIGGFRILLDIDSYTDISTGGTKSTRTLLGPRQLMVRASDAGQSLPYCKIDDVVMREAVPFYAFTKDRSDQRGTDIFVKSKPFPLVNTRGIVLMEFASS
jgi:hypothetical protein